MQNSSMPRTTLVLGVLLIAVGVIGWLAAGMSSWTALIPAILGVVLAVCGVLGRSNPKVWIHAALVVALIGALGTLRNVLGVDRCCGRSGCSRSGRCRHRVCLPVRFELAGGDQRIEAVALGLDVGQTEAACSRSICQRRRREDRGDAYLVPSSSPAASCCSLGGTAAGRLPMGRPVRRR